MGHLKGTFVMEEGEGSKNTNENEQEMGGQVSLYVRCEKNCLIVQTANRALSDKLLGSC